MTNDFEPRLTEVFRDVLQDPSLQLSDQLAVGDHPGWDSLGHVNLLVSLEDVFGVRFSTAEMGKLRSVADIRGALLARIP